MVRKSTGRPYIGTTRREVSARRCGNCRPVVSSLPDFGQNRNGPVPTRYFRYGAIVAGSSQHRRIPLLRGIITNLQYQFEEDEALYQSSNRSCLPPTLSNELPNGLHLVTPPLADSR